MQDKSLDEQIEAEEARLRGAYLQYNDAHDRLSEAKYIMDKLEMEIFMIRVQLRRLKYQKLQQQQTNPN